MKTFKQELNDGQIFPYYLLYGDEDYLKRQFKQMLLEKILPINESLNYLYVNNDKINLQEIIDFSETIPFLSEYRLIVFEDCKLFVSGSKKGAAISKELAKYLEQKDNDTKFVFIDSDIDKKSALYKFVKKNGREVEFKTQDEAILCKWISGVFKKENLSISSQGSKYLIQMCGTNMDNLKNECDKIISYKLGDENKVILKENIDNIVTCAISNQIYEMIRAIGSGKKAVAMKLYSDLLALKEDPMHILSLLFIEFKRILIIKSAVNNQLSPQEIATKAGLRASWMLKNYNDIISKFSIEEIKENLSYLVDLDWRGKTGLIDMKLSVEVFIGKTCK